MNEEQNIRSRRDLKISRVEDFLVTGEQFSVFWNQELGIGHTSPIPISLKKYYPKEKYISHKHKGSSLFESVYFFSQRAMIFYKYLILKKYIRQRDIAVDFGSGSGSFVSFLQKKTKKITGIDPSDNIKRIAKKREIRVQKNWNEIADGSLDFITAWHSLEHVLDLSKTLEMFQKKTKKRAFLFLALPNPESHDAKYYKRYWAAYDVPRHVWHFSKGGICKLLNQRGFRLLKTYHLPLDVFYISTLSLKNKKKRFAFLGGLVLGLWFFLKALFTNNPSSFIYIFQKRDC